MGEDESSVRVGLRIRPQIAREVIDMCRVCTSVTPGEPQVTLGPNKSFTFDYVFDTTAQQDEIYDICVAGLVDGAFSGYNATVLAYGQTGSGKTYTMGTGFEMNVREQEVGIIPRAIDHLFREIEGREEEAKMKGQNNPLFTITAQFMELYNEEIIDLFESADGFKPKGPIKIVEDPAGGGINVLGVATKPVHCANDALHLLRTGALSRTTASTQMNSESSRSHAIFTLIIKQQRVVALGEFLDGENTQGGPTTEFETLSAKFHFVDLAGSERLKRTLAVGDRQREGISINCGLLCLGNVISALGDKARRALHVPYRDSKLTRLLQDSLGGNSQTLMIACVSPSDRDFMETLNTLKYANRARNIKNRVTVNQDSSSKMIVALRSQVMQLELELAEYKQGKRVVGEDGVEAVNDMFHENTMLQSESHLLRTRVKAMQETVDVLKERNTQLLAEQACGRWGSGEEQPEVADIIKEYLREIEDLRAKLLESEKTCEILRKRESRPMHLMIPRLNNLDVSLGDAAVSSLIAEAKRDVEKDLHLLKAKEEKRISDPLDSDSDSDGGGDGDGGGDYNSDDSDAEEKEADMDGLDLAHLTTEITTKQKLIDQLEMSHQRIQIIKQHYEEKLTLLQTRIRTTQDERDKMMATFAGGSAGQKADKSSKKAQQDYDRKLQLMQKEVRSLQAALKKHEQMAKQNSQSEKQLKMLRGEMVEMKRAKVNLMKKMKEDTAKHKQVDEKRNREIAQLRKETRKRENQIRTLEADRKMKDVVLRRKNEEVSALRKNMRNGMSNKAAGRLRAAPDSNKGAFSPKIAKRKWQTLEKTINKIARNKHAIAAMEQEMERKLRERETLSHSLEDLMRRRRLAANEAQANDLDEQIEGTQANIDYIQEGISDAQQAIVTIEEAKEDGQDGLEVSSLVQTISEVDEARYLMEKLYNMTVNQSYSAAQKDMMIQEMEAKLVEEKQQNAIQKQLLDHLVDRHQYDIFSSSLAEEMLMSGLGIPESVGSSSRSSRSTSPTQADSCNGNGNGNGNTRMFSITNPKIRRRTALPEDLLYPNQPSLAPDADDASPGSNAAWLPVVNPSDPSPGGTVTAAAGYGEAARAAATNYADVFKVPNNYADPWGRTSSSYTEAMRPPSAPDSLKLMTSSLKLESLKPSPVMARKAYDRQDSTSPRPVRRNTVILPHSNLPGKLGSMEQGLDASPPGSPTAHRRGLRDENVFSRLTGGQGGSPSEQLIGKGVIAPFQGKISSRAALVCTHVAKGHSRAVLSVDATNDLMFSASKDRTVKVWDIYAGVEVASLQGHPNNVVSVKYHEESRLAFSMSSYMVKVWDMRDPSKCIKTLCSSGLPSALSVQTVAATRTLQYPQGETLLNAMTLNHSGSLLYAVANDKIRAWDLRKFSFELAGKLSGGHQAAVMCMAVGKMSEEEDVLITGSKDHYIKVFEVNRSSGAAVFTPKMNLDPPHYDGVQSLAIHGNVLFSGSRDTCIKKWDLTQPEPFQQSQNNAHKDWVTCLQFLPGGRKLLSGCRQGIMKIWSAETFSLLGEVKAHSEPINAIATNKSSTIFTASNDGNVTFWRANGRYFNLPDAAANNV